MDKEKGEQIEIALLAVIAVMMIVKTVMMSSAPAVDNSIRGDRSGVPQTFINDMGGITVQNPIPQTVQPVTPQSIQNAREITTMSFDQTTGDLGSMSAGDSKTFTYNVTNTGPKPLTFDQITADEGVTVISKPTAPIAPGGKGAITIQLTAGATTGSISKTIHIGSNTEPAHMHLTLTANVQ